MTRSPRLYKRLKIARAMMMKKMSVSRLGLIIPDNGWLSQLVGFWLFFSILVCGCGRLVYSLMCWRVRFPLCSLILSHLLACSDIYFLSWYRIISVVLKYYQLEAKVILLKVSWGDNLGRSKASICIAMMPKRMTSSWNEDGLEIYSQNESIWFCGVSQLNGLENRWLHWYNTKIRGVMQSLESPISGYSRTSS